MKSFIFFSLFLYFLFPTAPVGFTTANTGGPMCWFYGPVPGLMNNTDGNFYEKVPLLSLEMGLQLTWREMMQVRGPLPPALWANNMFRRWTVPVNSSGPHNVRLRASPGSAFFVPGLTFLLLLLSPPAQRGVPVGGRGGVGGSEEGSL